jgi:hypothetical protein
MRAEIEYGTNPIQKVKGVIGCLLEQYTLISAALDLNAYSVPVPLDGWIVNFKPEPTMQRFWIFSLALPQLVTMQ